MYNEIFRSQAHTGFADQLQSGLIILDLSTGCPENRVFVEMSKANENVLENSEYLLSKMR